MPHTSLTKSKADTLGLFLRKVAASASRTIWDFGTRRWRAVASRCALILSGILQVIVVMTRDNTRLHNEQYLKHSTAIHLFWESGVRDVVNVAPFQLGKERRLLVHFAGSSQSFWKRGSFRSGSNIGSSRSSAGVSGVFCVASGPAYDIESSFCKAAMARSGSPVRAATRARISIEAGPDKASFSIGFAAIAFSTNAKAAALSPRPILVSARSPRRPKFSGWSLRKGSNSLRACRQLSWAAA